MKVLLTGGTGFIGKHLLDVLLKQGASLTVLSRKKCPDLENKCVMIIGDLKCHETIEGICRGIDTVIHLGGYAHSNDDLDENSRRENWAVTVEGTRFLVNEAVKSGVERFLFVSSVKAMGEGGPDCLDEETESRPMTEYGKAKREAEKIVCEANRHGLKSTIFRLPMVYGPHCKGNLPRMIKAISRGRFPPFPETGNKRSMVDVRDVVQAALLAVSNPVSVNKIYLVTDDQIYSTRMIYLWICQALRRPVPHWTMSPVLMKAAAHVGGIVNLIAGKQLLPDMITLNKLMESAWYSSGRIKRDLNFIPRFSLQDALPIMVKQII